MQIPNRRVVSVLAAAVCALAAREGACEALEYRIDLPADQMISYVLALDVREPGLLSVEADWSAERMLTFRLEGPTSPAVRRTGLPPQKFEITVGPEELGDAKWTLAIRGLPSNHAGNGTLRLLLPEKAAATVPELSPAEAPQPASREPWEAPRAVPPGAPADAARLYAAAERYRRLVVDAEPKTPDTCRWQSEFLRYLARARDERTDTAATPDSPSLRIFARMAAAVAAVESLRTSEDPLLDQPPAGADALERQAWQVVFHHRTAPVRATLDDLLHDLQHGRAPALESEEWPSRFLSCLAACERHFEERRSRGDAAASNRRLVEDQWERIVAAGDALDALAGAWQPAD